jgi:hypothetical protein
MISTIKKLKSALLGLVVVMFVPSISAHAYDLNMPGFSGTVNTTVTSGFTMRTGERNCLLQDGIKYNVNTSDLGAPLLGLLSVETDLTAAQVLTGGSTNYLFSDTCSGFQTDAYGNTSTNRLPFGSVNADDGNLNFDDGDIVDATQKVFTEITGTTDSGIGVNLSFIGSYNPVLDLTTESFKKLTSAAADELESDISVLDAYITTSFDAGGDFGFVDVTAGNFVTSWGEATFIPVGLNGFVTNALDLTKLRAPGASIRDSLMPTEQISIAFSAGDFGVEVYSQFDSEKVALDPKGSFFGSDVAGTGGDRIMASGPYESEFGHEASCPGYAVILAGQTCNKALHDSTLATATRSAYNDAYNLRNGLSTATATQWTYWTGVGAGVDHGGAFQSLVGAPPAPQFTVVEDTLAAFTTSGAANVAALSTVYGGIDETDYTKAAAVELRMHEQKYAAARDDGQWGIRASTYVDNIGSGIDLGFYYANYHSKTPYIQMMGKTGVLAGDIIGAFTAVSTDFLGQDSTNANEIDNAFHIAGTEGVGAVGALAVGSLMVPYVNGAYGSAVCGGLGAALANSTVSVGNTIDDEVSKQVYQNLTYKKVIDGVGKVHNPATCNAANTLGGTEYMPIFLSLTPTLAAAVTPLNYAEYQFIYPEDNQIFGLSFSTTVGGTVVQGEVSYRPDFPLATSAGDQINQIADASGTTLALTAFGHDTYALSPANITPGVALPATVNALATASAISKDFGTLLKAAKRSSLPVIDPTLVKVYDATSYYRSNAFINYDVYSVDLGTTTSFSASHPLTKNLGADSAYFLTELAMVQIDSMDNINNGFVARNGFNEGSGEHLCLGIFNGLTSAEIAAVNAQSGQQAIDYDLSSQGGVTNLGASIVDAVFGNGSYCEGQMGADKTSYSYRLVGGATYNNFNNSTWSITPNFVWSHDPKGYGPSSLGGFVDGRQSLSLGLTASKGDAISAAINYVEQMGDEKANLRNDMDYMSASLSYSF